MSRRWSRNRGLGKYILDGKVPRRVPDDDVMVWGLWFEKSSRDGSRFVAKDEHLGVCVSTVFLGLDHAFGHGAPMLFETMILAAEGARQRKGKNWDEHYQDRYSTWGQAEAGHRRACMLAGVPCKSLPPLKQDGANQDGDQDQRGNPAPAGGGDPGPGEPDAGNQV